MNRWINCAVRISKSPAQLSTTSTIVVSRIQSTLTPSLGKLKHQPQNASIFTLTSQSIVQTTCVMENSFSIPRKIEQSNEGIIFPLVDNLLLADSSLDDT
jgi:hypothetical protein